jgi:hypothetical protein
LLKGVTGQQSYTETRDSTLPVVVDV